MQVNANTPDNILSLLIEIAKCSFVRVTEFKKNGRIRHQFGNENLASLINEELHDSDSIITNSPALHFGDYQFFLKIVSPKHAHIDCRVLLKNDSLQYTPKPFVEPNSVLLDHSPRPSKHDASLNNRRYSDGITHTNGYSHTSRIIIELLEHEGLPEFILQLRTHFNPTTAPQTQQAWLSSLLLKTLCVSIESLRLIDHYVELTSDSLTKLRSRTALQTGIDEKIQRSSMTLCMVHCTDFQQVNRKFGQAQGDIVLHEIAGVIEQQTRIDDICGRFGGALFGVAINANTPEDGFVLASKLKTALHNKMYLNNATRLTFNIGLAFVSQEEDQIDSASTSSLLISRAEQALKAAQTATKPTIVQWEPDKFRLDQQEFNYVGGIFTPDNVTNYRNMLLLWDISSIIADEHTFERLLKSVIERLAFTFEFAYAGIVSIDDTVNKHAKQSEAFTRNYSFELQNATDIVDLPWEDYPHKALIHKTAVLAIQSALHTKSQENGLNTLVIPLDNDSNECFFITGNSKLLDLTHDTVMLLVGFARQLGKAFKRSQLEDQLNRNLEQQNAKLSQELLELKAGMQSSALVYRSPKMQKIVEQTQRAAQTDTTVLITGESGTGKEKLINAIHALSTRNEKPLIIVDCGSIPETLIESELFGHIKGAFTGAQNSTTGKIQAAHGGILVLDEIGELPISMQPKLLRFVQEKQFTPIGGNKSIEVDVKIVAVTNRDLAFEVSQNRFRKDLFYRLNVVTLHNPPLRERKEDIDLLSQHFLSKFARQFQMDRKHVSHETIALMQSYSWPGNIRELENKLMQASLLTTDDEIFFDDLNLVPEISAQSHYDAAEPMPINNDAHVLPTNPSHTNSTQMHSANNSAHGSFEAKDRQTEHVVALSDIALPEQWCSQFAKCIDDLLASISMQTMMNASIGNTIEQVVLHMAHKERGSHAKTAVLLQLPTSTARRKLQKAPPDISGFEHESNWALLEGLLAKIVSNEVQLTSPLDIIRHIIAQSILTLHATNMALASQLMGVSEPTMYKLRKQLQP